MKRLLLVIFCVLAFPVWASHIVGGEFEILYISGSTYRVNLILYFDLANGNPGARDQSVSARIYRKRDNVAMQNVFLPLTNESTVAYTQPSCSVGGVRTSKIIYTTTIQMPATQYNDPQGYYIVWERCCRNYNEDRLLNIVSVDPAGSPNNPNAAGQTFYLEFPPVVKDGKPFINSSPQLFPPLSDYACINKPYYTNFAGSDVDGDSLSYTLVTPLNTKTSVALPLGGPGPAPYPEVKWLPPYSLNNIIGGSPDLKISPDGLLTVTPGSIVGLFVFAVRCDEFRDGVKIGELRRDFQMYVLDCPAADPPVVEGRMPGSPSFVGGTMNVTFANTVSDDDRYVEIRVSDPDVDRSPQFREQITKIRVIPLGFKTQETIRQPTARSATLTQIKRDTVFRIYFNECPYIEGPFQLGVIAEDDACALPLMDTLKLNVTIQQPANNNATFLTANVTNLDVKEGDPMLTWDIEAEDIDGDVMVLYPVTEEGVTLAAVGMNLEAPTQVVDPTTGKRLLKTKFTWDPRCDAYDFTKKTEFLIKVFVYDIYDCPFKHLDTLIFKLKIKLPGNADPVISTDLPASSVTNGITKKVYETISFKVFGNDADNDLLILSAQGKDFNMSDYGASFPTKTGNGYVTSDFNWNITCEKLNLAKKDVFEFDFIVVDNANKCRFYKADTLTVKVTVKPAVNTGPKLDIANKNWEIPFVNPQSIVIGQEIALDLIAVDGDKNPEDNIKIEMIEATGNVPPVGYEFAPAEGLGDAKATFSWTPDCSVFLNRVYENNYTFKFRAIDNRCANVKADTVQLDITIKDIDGSDTEFLPPNIITPNEDGCNDYFAMEEIEAENLSQCGDVVMPKLPADNCMGRFTKVFIYNRWGKLVFSSDKRNFRWHASSESVGVYFYTLQYTHREYKGTISVRY